MTVPALSWKIEIKPISQVQRRCRGDYTIDAAYGQPELFPTTQERPGSDTKTVTAIFSRFPDGERMTCRRGSAPVTFGTRQRYLAVVASDVGDESGEIGESEMITLSI